MASIARRAASLPDLATRFRRSEEERQRQRDAGRRPADLSGVLIVVVLGLLLAFGLGLVLGLVLQCGP
jgi:hypothetical protein